MTLSRRKFTILFLVCVKHHFLQWQKLQEISILHADMNGNECCNRRCTSFSQGQIKIKVVFQGLPEKTKLIGIEF